MELSEWLRYQTPKIRSNCKVVRVAAAYHISKSDKIKRFVPMVGNRQADTEDRTIPRVCCGATVLDSIRGHAEVAWAQLDEWFEGQHSEFAIYKMPFTEYLKPTSKLVFDADFSNELWIVPNDATTVAFKAPIVGHFMMEEYTRTIRVGMDIMTCVFVVRTSEPVTFDADAVMDGYYRVVITSAAMANQNRFEHPFKTERLEKISASSYNAVLNKIKRNLK